METKAMTFTLRPHQQDMLAAMAAADKGILQCPTGGGKTLTIITDCKQYLKPGKVVVVVGPQLLLGRQLFNEFDKHLSDIQYDTRQISSEKTTWHRARQGKTFRVIPADPSTTVLKEIEETYAKSQRRNMPLVLFTTYDSLYRIVEADIPVDVIYYDEAHNGTGSNVFAAIAGMTAKAVKSYYFTATPRYSNGSAAGGMDNTEVFGNILSQVKFGPLVEAGYILQPRIQRVFSGVDVEVKDELQANIASIKEVVKHCEENGESTKFLFCMQGTQAIANVLASNFTKWAKDKGYNLLAIDSQNQGYINGERGVVKGKFIDRLNHIGATEDKLIVLHYSMLGEGIDVKSLGNVVFLRTGIGEIFGTQSIGRVLRTDGVKKYGNVIVVQHNNDNGQCHDMVYRIVESLFRCGVPPSSLLTGEDGRSTEEEVVEDLEDKVQTIAAELQADFEWTNTTLPELLTTAADDLEW